MNPRVLLAALAAVVVALVLVTSGDDRPRTLRVPLDNAAGLESGSDVRLGGETIGQVELQLDDRDRVYADLELRDDAPRLGRDVQVRVRAANFLGQKRVELTARRGGPAAPDGYVVPRRQVTTPTDLDQVLDVLDAPTRTRLQVLINEAGEALVGRKVDLRQFLQEFPLGERDATRLIEQLETDDATMRNLVVRAERFVGEAARQRRELTRMIDAVGETAETVSAKRAQLQATLDKAPGTLRTLQAFLGDLERTTGDLRSAVREVKAVAPSLRATLAGVDDFADAAGPALDSATGVAPELTKLAKGATPVLRRAEPAAERLAELGAALTGVTDTLDGSVENVFSILHNWSRAIQFRDQLSHVFRGEASLTPDLLMSAVQRLGRGQGDARRSTAGRKSPSAPAAPGEQATPKRDPAPKPSVKDVIERLPKTPAIEQVLEDLPKDPTVEQVGKALEDVVGGLTEGGGGKGAQTAPSPSDQTGFLDLLFGP